MAYKIPYTFIPGTKAKANEVNSNFSSVAEYLTEVNTNLISTTSDLNSTKENLDDAKVLFRENKTKFCVNSCPGTLITTAGTAIYFNSTFVITNTNGISETITSCPSINCASLADGTYNIFVGVDSTNEYFANTIYRQKTEPSEKKQNDIWLNTSIEPIFAGKWDGTIWVEYKKVPVGSFTMLNGSITATKIFDFNENGYNVTTNSPAGNGSLSNLTSEGKKVITSNAIVDYSKPTTLSWNTVYQAPSDGYIYSRAYLSDNKHYYVEIGETNTLGTTICYTKITDVTNTLQMVVPIPKGYYYKISGNGSNTLSTFYPMKGAN